MTFKEAPRFPEDISFGGVGGPGWKTDVVTVGSGHEKRNALWSKMRHRYEVSHAVKTEDHFKKVRAHFLIMNGRQHSFRYKDPADFRCAIDEGRVSGLTTTTFQLVKRYGIDSETVDREIKKPLASGFVLKNSGSTLTLTTDYTLDATTGIVTTVVPRTAANLTWSGTFDVPVRYDIDELRAQVVNRNLSSGLLLVWESIPLVEVRP